MYDEPDASFYNLDLKYPYDDITTWSILLYNTFHADSEIMYPCLVQRGHVVAMFCVCMCDHLLHMDVVFLCVTV